MGMTGEKLTARVFTIYGESKRSLEYAIDATLDVTITDVIDNCEINVKQAIYHRAKEKFMIEVENVQDTECYVDLELTDVLIADEQVTLGLEGAAKLLPKDVKMLEIPAVMTDYDIEKNRFIDITAYYGQRENSLTKIWKGKLELIIKRFDVAFYAVVTIVVILILLLILLLARRRRKDEDE